MKARLFNHSLGFAVLIAFAQVLHAQSCAGGAGGGMDATGNECSDARWQTNDTSRIVVPVTGSAARTLSAGAHRPASHKGTTLREPADKRRFRRVSRPR